MQGTGAYLTDEAARPGMLELARAGLLHVLGSDSHSSRAGRPVALAAAFEVLGTVFPEAAQIDWMARTAPRAIVNGEEIRPPL